MVKSQFFSCYRTANTDQQRIQKSKDTVSWWLPSATQKLGQQSSDKSDTVKPTVPPKHFLNLHHGHQKFLFFFLKEVEVTMLNASAQKCRWQPLSRNTHFYPLFSLLTTAKEISLSYSYFLPSNIQLLNNILVFFFIYQTMALSENPYILFSEMP